MIVKKPCTECPYRKDSLKGWLGEDMYNPISFLAQLDFMGVHPCHKTIDWEIATETQIEQAPKCVGALQFMNNSAMLSKFPEVREMQKFAGKNDDVMQYKHNFIKHHER